MAYTTEPSIIIVANDSFSASRASAAATALGAHIVSTISLSEAVLRLNNQIVPDAIFLELAEDGGALFDHALDQIDAIAAREGAALLVSITPDLIDPVTARLRSPSVTLLCNPTSAERVAGLALALGERSARVHDRSQEFDALRLQNLADEVGRIAKTLANITMTPSLSGAHSSVSDATLGYKFESDVMYQPEISSSEIRSIIKLRRMRELHFDAELFADPAWDMMLDLMAARVESGRVSVSSLCIAAAVPATTALRWIKTMTDQGLFVRVADPTDGRRVFIELSDVAAGRITTYLTQTKKAGGLSI